MKKNTTKKLAAILSFAVVCAGALGVASLNTATADAAVNPDCFEMVEGASIRLASDKNGIRFTSKYGSNVYQDITTREGTDVRVGTYILPAAYLNMQAAYVDGATIGEYDKLKEECRKDACFYDSTDDTIENKLYQDGDYYYGYAALTNMQFENLGLDFVGIGYIAWTKDGITTYDFIQNEETVVRSAAYVASAHYGKETDATKVEVVDHYAYGSLFAKTGVVTYDASLGQYTVYGDDTYSTVAEVMTAINGSLELSVSETTMSVAYPETQALTASVQLKYAAEKDGEATEVANGVNFAVKCESSNPAAAVYENGVVKTAGKGATTLTFSCMGLEATCEVNVIQRTVKSLTTTDFDLSKDTVATIALDEGEVATKVLVGETDIIADVTPAAGSVAIPKSVLETWNKDTTHVEIFTQNYQYNAYVCVADYVLSDEAEFIAFRAAAKAASDQHNNQLASANKDYTLTKSDTWDWFVVMDADITCTTNYAGRVSYFGILDGRGHALSNVKYCEDAPGWDTGGFFDNRIQGGDVGVTDMNGVMHEKIGMRLKNIAIIDFEATRGAFIGTPTCGSEYKNIYMNCATGLVNDFIYINNGISTARTGDFSNIIVETTKFNYFPWITNKAQTWTNIESATRIHMFSANPQLPQGYENTAYTDATAFYNGVKASLVSDSWNKNIWKVAENGDITFGGKVIIENPAN